VLYISSFTPPIGFEWSPWCAFNSAFDKIRITIPGRWCHVYRVDGYYDVYTAHCIVIHKVISEGSGRLNILYRQPRALSMQSHSGVPLPSSHCFVPMAGIWINLQRTGAVFKYLHCISHSHGYTVDDPQPHYMGFWMLPNAHGRLHLQSYGVHRDSVCVRVCVCVCVCVDTMRVFLPFSRRE